MELGPQRDTQVHLFTVWLSALRDKEETKMRLPPEALCYLTSAQPIWGSRCTVKHILWLKGRLCITSRPHISMFQMKSIDKRRVNWQKTDRQMTAYLLEIHFPWERVNLLPVWPRSTLHCVINKRYNWEHTQWHTYIDTCCSYMLHLWPCPHIPSVWLTKQTEIITGISNL